jgi:hypothetical protein
MRPTLVKPIESNFICSIVREIANTTALQHLRPTGKNDKYKVLAAQAYLL